MPKKSKIITTTILFVIILTICSSKFIFAEPGYATNFEDLQNKINSANDDDTVIIGNDITLSETLIVTKKIKIIGNSNFKLTLPSGSTIRHITSSTDLQIDNLTFDGGGTGGGVEVTSGSITVTNSNFINNNSLNNDPLNTDPLKKNGAAINLKEGSFVDITNSTFKNNVAFEGGAIYTKGNINLTNCEFDNNQCTHSENPQGRQGEFTNINGGGAVCAINNSNVTVENSIFSNNTVNSRGGAIFVSGSINITGSLFENNKNTNFDYIAGYGGAIFAARSNGTFNVHKCQFNKNSSGAGGGICSFIPLTITNSCFDSNRSGNGKDKGHGAAVMACVTKANLINSTFTKSYGSAVLAYDSSKEYAESKTPEINTINSTFWGNDGGGWYYENITYSFNSSDGATLRWPKEPIITYSGCIMAYSGDNGKHVDVKNCVGYDDDYYASIDKLFMSKNPTLNYHDTEIKIGTGDNTLQIGYYPIKPFGRADDKIDNSIEWMQTEDQNGVLRGQKYINDTKKSDIGAVEELGEIYVRKTKEDSGDNQVAIVKKEFTSPLKVQAYYNSTTQPEVKEMPLSQFDFNPVLPVPEENGASATLSANNIVTDDQGNAQITATTNDKSGEYTVRFAPSTVYKGRIIEIVPYDGDDKNYFDNIDFKLTNISKTFHVRQVVINSASGLEVPHSGYFVLSDSDSSDINNITVDSGKHEFGVNYTKFSMNAKLKSQYKIVPIIPEYYEYAGHIMTETYTDHDPNSRSSESPSLNFISDINSEYWVTIYITPKNPDTHSWSDAVNDFFTQR